MMGIGVEENSSVPAGHSDDYISPGTISSKYAKCIPGDPSTYSHLTDDEKKEWSEQLRTDLKSSLSKFL